MTTAAREVTAEPLATGGGVAGGLAGGLPASAAAAEPAPAATTYSGRSSELLRQAANEGCDILTKLSRTCRSRFQCAPLSPAFISEAKAVLLLRTTKAGQRLVGGRGGKHSDVHSRLSDWAPAPASRASPTSLLHISAPQLSVYFVSATLCLKQRVCPSACLPPALPPTQGWASASAAGEASCWPACRRSPPPARRAGRRPSLSRRGLLVQCLAFQSQWVSCHLIRTALMWHCMQVWGPCGGADMQVLMPALPLQVAVGQLGFIMGYEQVRRFPTVNRVVFATRPEWTALGACLLPTLGAHARCKRCAALLRCTASHWQPVAGATTCSDGSHPAGCTPAGGHVCPEHDPSAAGAAGGRQVRRDRGMGLS